MTCTPGHDYSYEPRNELAEQASVPQPAKQWYEDMRYPVAFRRLESGVDVYYGESITASRALAAMVESRLWMRGYHVATAAKDDMISVAVAGRRTSLDMSRIVAETRAAIRECRRISRANINNLWRAA